MDFPTTPTAQQQQQKPTVFAAATAATTIDDLHSDVLADILLRLDGPALASVACADSCLRSLASDRALWERLCFSSFPSLALRPELLNAGTSQSPRQFFSRAFPFPAYSSSLIPLPSLPPPPSCLVSAVDVYHRGELLYCALVDTETQSSWFLSFPLCIDAVNRADGDVTSQPCRSSCSQSPPNTIPISPEDLTLSWILIDPKAGDAVNLSSHQPVTIERHSYAGEIQARFASVLSGGAGVATITVTLEGSGPQGQDSIMRVKQICLGVEDGVEGSAMNGKESLDLFRRAMSGSRNRVVNGGLEESKRQTMQRYRDYERRKREWKERKAAREGRVDLCCTVLWASLILSTIAVVFR